MTKKYCIKTNVNKNCSNKKNSNNYIKKYINKYKHYLLDRDDDDENEVVNWIDNNNIKQYFDCGCCEDCLCDDNIKCTNCGCNCNGDDDSDGSDGSDDSDGSANTNDKSDCKDISEQSNFNINIIKNETDEKLVRITLQLNVMLDNKKTEIINIDLDINSKTYLKIAEELFKK
jgi:hypothetical protein